MMSVNLFAWRDEARQKSQFLLKQGLVIVAGISLIVLICGHISLLHQIHRAQITEAYLKNELTLLEIKSKNQMVLEEQRDENRKALSNFKILEGLASGNYELLVQLSKNLPKNVALTFIQRVNNEIILRGNAAQISDVAILVQNLTKIKMVKK